MKPAQIDGVACEKHLKSVCTPAGQNCINLRCSKNGEHFCMHVNSSIFPVLLCRRSSNICMANHASIPEWFEFAGHRVKKCFTMLR